MNDCFEDKAPSVSGALADTSVEMSFGRAAKTYWENAAVQRALGEWLSEWLPMRREGRALEVGAGPGLFTRLLVPWLGYLRATDISNAMCQAGRLRVPTADWRQMAAEFPDDGPWDFMISCGMFQWIDNPAAVLAAWKAELAPGGRIIAALFASESLSELREAMGEDGPVSWRTPEDWRAAAEAAGLRVIRDTVKLRTFHNPSATALMRGLHLIGAAPERKWSPSRMRRFLRDYDARNGSDQGVTSTWTFYRFEASSAG